MAIIDYGKPPQSGWAPAVIELYVRDIAISYQFWSQVLQFKIAYQRPQEHFMYLENAEGAHVMLYQNPDDGNTSASGPFLLQLFVSSIAPVLSAIKKSNIQLDRGPEGVWRRWGDRMGGKREIRLRDPDGHRILVAEDIGEKPL